jgi:hypothetical protein
VRATRASRAPARYSDDDISTGLDHEILERGAREDTSIPF